MTKRVKGDDCGEIERECDRLGLELRATTDPENVEYIQLLERRGFERTSVELRRRPKA